MVPQHAQLVKPMWPEVQPPAQWVWDRLRFIMVIEAGQVAPAGVAADFDETRAEHDPEDEPAKKPNDDGRGRPFRKGPAIEQRTEEYRQETGFEQLDFPTVSIPVLAHMDERQVKGPKNRHQGR